MPSQSITRGSKPKNWPPEIPFLTTPVYSKTIQKPHFTFLRTKNATDLTLPTVNIAKGPCSLVKITPISTPSHPACGQSGLFATSDLKPGTFILQYMGVLHVTPSPIPSSSPDSNSNSDPVQDPAMGVKGVQVETMDPHANSNYDLSLDREMGIGIDADKCGTEARFINDYRGVAAGPNAEFREIWDGNRNERGMGVFVMREGKGRKGKGDGGKAKGLRKGEEILVSYGRGFWGARRGDGV